MNASIHLGLAPAALRSTDTLQAALADADEARADALMRAATEALLAWQLQHAEATGLSVLDAAQAREQMQQGFVAGCVIGRFGRHWDERQLKLWQRCSDALGGQFDPAVQPQLPLHGDCGLHSMRLQGDGAAAPAQAVGPASYDLASLLRDPARAWPEEQELDWAIRYWEKARKAGLPLDADFGAFWQQLEWTGLQRHLWLAGRADIDGERLARLLAHAVKVSTRYVQLAGLTQLLQDLQGGLVQTGFTLR